MVFLIPNPFLILCHSPDHDATLERPEKFVKGEEMGWVCGEGKVKFVSFKSRVWLTFAVVIKGNLLVL